MRIKTSPGEILHEEYLKPLELSANAFAKCIGVPANRVSGIINGTRSVTPDTALRLSRALNTTPEFWLNAQMAFDLSNELARPSRTLKRIRPIEPQTVSSL